MREWRPLLILLPWLFGFTPLPAPVLSTDTVHLGEPLILRQELPEAELELTGTPDIAGFRLLSPPAIEGRELRVELLPVRPGQAVIPGWSLHTGNRTWRTAPLQVEVLDTTPEKAEPRPLKPLPRRQGNGISPHWSWLLIGLPVAWWIYRCANPPAARPTGTAADELALLQRRLRKIRQSDESLALLEALEQWRFGPYRADVGLIRRMREAIDRLGGNGP